MKDVISHHGSCNGLQTPNGCEVCKKCILICSIHANKCQDELDPGCLVPYCSTYRKNQELAIGPCAVYESARGDPTQDAGQAWITLDWCRQHLAHLSTAPHFTDLQWGQSLSHVYRCQDAGCQVIPTCRLLKNVMSHTRDCEIDGSREHQTCETCNSFIELHRLHVPLCQEDKCSVYSCTARKSRTKRHEKIPSRTQTAQRDTDGHRGTQTGIALMM